jgi:hypothetical protein
MMNYFVNEISELFSTTEIIYVKGKFMLLYDITSSFVTSSLLNISLLFNNYHREIGYYKVGIRVVRSIRPRIFKYL